MKIFVNRKIRFLFAGILWCAIAFTLISVLFAAFEVKNAAYYIIGCGLCMAAVILLFCYAYFKEQHKIMENAIAQITEYISGDKNVTIECNDEGELYRLLKNTILDISHQLKTPLAALNIYNGIIQGEAESMPAIKEFADFSEQELERIETLVQNLLKISKFDAGTIVMMKTSENVSEMMERIKKRFSFRAGQEGKEIILAGDESIDFICDRNWLMEAVGNIVKNALDHTEKGDFVRIEWKLSASALQITVKDNGSGIYPEDLYYIFKRFYRSRYSKDTQGIGLGLPLAKSIIEAHGGSIAVDSEPGKGAIFYLYLIEH